MNLKDRARPAGKEWMETEARGKGESVAVLTFLRTGVGIRPAPRESIGERSSGNSPVKSWVIAEVRRMTDGRHETEFAEHGSF